MNDQKIVVPQVLPLKGLTCPPGGAVVVHHAAGVLHLELWVSDVRGEGWLLNMNLRGLERETAWTAPAWFIVPTNNAGVLEDVSRAARRLWRAAQSHSIQYGFDDQGLTLDAVGQLTLQDGTGLTCASLLLLLFEMANAPLLARGEWRDVSPARREADRADRARLIRHLQSRSPDDAARLTAQLTTPRFRPEEVAAASGMSGTPLTLGQAQRGASALLEAIGLPDNDAR